MSKLDGLGREVADWLGTIKSLGILDVEVVVLQLGQLDQTSTAGRLMPAMLAAVPEMERDLIVSGHKWGWLGPWQKGRRAVGPPKRRQHNGRRRGQTEL